MRSILKIAAAVLAVLAIVVLCLWADRGICYLRVGVRDRCVQLSSARGRITLVDIPSLPQEQRIESGREIDDSLAFRDPAAGVARLPGRSSIGLFNQRGNRFGPFGWATGNAFPGAQVVRADIPVTTTQPFLTGVSTQPQLRVANITGALASTFVPATGPMSTGSSQSMQGGSITILASSGSMSTIMLMDMGGRAFPYRAVIVPHWALAAVLSTPLTLSVAVRLIRWGRRRRRIARGLCATCGYDLRGNVSGKCPECGAVGLGAGEPGTIAATSNAA